MFWQQVVRNGFFFELLNDFRVLLRAVTPLFVALTNLFDERVSQEDSL